jgi:hypothetical protein
MLQLRRTVQTIDLEEGMPPTFEFLLNEVEGEHWTFLRNQQVRLPLEQVYGRSPWGIRAARPEILLLHKAVYKPRPKDDHDFRVALPTLGAHQREWLRQRILEIYPGHPWIEHL